MPTVLVIEDVHWADEATLDLLRFLARRIGATPLLLVVTYRDDELEADHPLRLLARRPGDGSARPPAAAGAPVARRVAVLAARTARPGRAPPPDRGNPFFVTEVLAADGEAIPATVRDAVLARAARLSPPARAVLDAAAVMARRSTSTWLLAVAGLAAPATSTSAWPRDAAGPRRRRRLPPRAGARGRGRRSRRGAAGLHGRVLAALQARPGAADLARLAHHAEAAATPKRSSSTRRRPPARPPRWAPTGRRPPSTPGPCASPTGWPRPSGPSCSRAAPTSAT